ncbi:YigZ family protein [Absicoccus porci]|uniref:YigZ family protein n=1 Tax=Absicoccus porci TaxID=2486576 RepID=UPI00294223AC|nr:YigZ family protein [Absicoccus porci]
MRIMEDVTNTIEIKKSKFITYLHRTNDEQEAKEFLKQIKKSHPQARHYCTAMIIGNIVRSNDDGEPSQTAGHPMLDVLLHNQMEDIFVVVVRYFGGIKLGTGGLVRAYSSSVKEALDKATKSETKLLEEYTITFGYDLIGKLDAYFRIHQIEITLKDYNEQVTYQYLTDHDITSDLKELSNGSIQPISIGQIEWETPI